MTRINLLSLLLALLVLLQVAITSTAETLYQIANANGETLKSYPTIRNPELLEVIIDSDVAGKFERWTLQRQEDGKHVISNIGTDYSLFAYKDVLYTAPGLQQAWFLERAGRGAFYIRAPNGGKVVTALSDGKLILAPADNSPAQKFYFLPIKYSKYEFYRQ
ncbi:hypothetical protein BGX28_005635 [Mortierella sp. GBA30]|nr:hypothetical protein BGX28_005635 [Mortierella sp. GBA30]